MKQLGSLPFILGCALLASQSSHATGRLVIGADAPHEESGQPAIDAEGDTRVVDFYLPHEFEQALKASKQQNRCLLIKGVAFGIDAAGEKCATKGHW